MNRYIYKAFLRNKKIRLLGLLLSIFLIIYLFLFYIDMYINMKFINKIKNKEENRMFRVTLYNDKEGKDIEDILNYLEDVGKYQYIYNESNLLIVELGDVRLYNSFSENLDLFLGKENDIYCDEVVLPRYLYIDDKIVDTSYLLNSYITIKLDSSSTLEKKYNVVGIYKNDKNDKRNIIYISTNSLINYESNNLNFLFLINEQINVSEITNFLERNGVKVTFYNEQYKNELYVYDSLHEIIFYFKNFIYYLFLIIYILILIDFFKNEHFNFLLLEAIGYSHFNIIFNIISFFITILFLLLIALGSIFLFLIYISELFSIMNIISLFKELLLFVTFIYILNLCTFMILFLKYNGKNIAYFLK